MLIRNEIILYYKIFFFFFLKKSRKPANISDYINIVTRDTLIFIKSICFKHAFTKFLIVLTQI